MSVWRANADPVRHKLLSDVFHGRDESVRDGGFWMGGRGQGWSRLSRRASQHGHILFVVTPPGLHFFLDVNRSS